MDYQLPLHNLAASFCEQQEPAKLIHAMVAAVTQRFFLVLCLFHVLIDAAFSRLESDRKPGHLSQNVSTKSPTMKSSPDYMLRLLQKVTNPEGDLVHAGAVRGNLIYGITENG